MTPANALILTSAAMLLLSTTTARSSIEAGEGEGGGPAFSFNFDNLTDKAETIVNTITEQPASVPADMAGANVSAFLRMIQSAEGTANEADPYRVCYGYKHTVQNLGDHPALTGEWRGERLPDAMCRNAGFGPGCVSSAAGAYQIIKPTWANLKTALRLPDFGPESQDAACVELIRRRGALEDVKAGRVAAAIAKIRNEWASLPGNYAKQGQRSVGDLIAWYQGAGGYTA